MPPKPPHNIPRALALAILLSTTPTFAVTTEWIGPDQGTWTEPLNWSNGLPSSALDVIIAPSASGAVLLNTTATVNSFSQSVQGTLVVADFQALSLLGSSHTNDGIISLTSSTSQMTFAVDATLNGAGTVVLSGASSQIYSAPNTRLHNSQLIIGNGIVRPFLLTNSGTITATGGTLRLAPALQSNAIVNSGILRADGGTLQVFENTSGPTPGILQNTGGLIEASANSSILLPSQYGILTGGTIQALSGGSITLGGTITNVVFNGLQGSSLRITTGFLDSATLNGSIQGNGAFLKNSITNNAVFTQNASPALVGNFTLNGSGTLVLATSQFNSWIDGVLTNNSNILSAVSFTFPSFNTLINTGTITSGAGIFNLKPGDVFTGFKNSGLLRADGGSLVLNSANFALNNAGGVIEATNQSRVIVNRAVSGGSIRANSGGIVSLLPSNVAAGIIQDAEFQSNGGTIVLSGSTLINPTINAYLSISGGASFSGAMANSGTISVPGGGNSLTFNKDTLLTGSGSILMSASTITGSGSPFPRLTNANTIIGNGTLGSGRMLLTNLGGIIASGGDLIVSPRGNSTDELINNGLFRAAAGRLFLIGGVLSNTAGTIEALEGGNVYIYLPLNGGVLRSDSASAVTIASPFTSQGNAIFRDFMVLGNLAFIDVPPLFFGSTAKPLLSGTINNLGLISFVHAANQTVQINLTGNTFLSGSGTLTLSTVGAATSRLAVNSVGPDYILFSDNVINGSGFIGGPRANLSNSGSVIANASSGITIAASGTAGFVSTGTLRADAAPLTITNTGTLPGFVTLSGTIEAINGGTLLLAASNSTTTVSSPINLSNGHLTITGTASLANITGTGNVTLNAPASMPITSDGITTSTLTLNGTAIHTLRPNNATTGTSKVNSLIVTSDTTNAFTAKLDLTNNTFILQTDPTIPGDKTSKLSLLQSALTAGYNHGNWLGLGITSSTVAADQSVVGSHLTALALFDNESLQLPTIAGISADSNSLFITTALIGDTNFDQAVNQTDFDLVVQNWQTLQTNWTTGDLNYDGFVDILDAVLIATHAQSPINTGTFLQGYPLPIPEPTSAVLLLPLTLLLQRRTLRRALSFYSS